MKLDSIRSRIFRVFFITITSVLMIYFALVLYSNKFLSTKKTDKILLEKANAIVSLIEQNYKTLSAVNIPFYKVLLATIVPCDVKDLDLSKFNLTTYPEKTLFAQQSYLRLISKDGSSLYSSKKINDDEFSALQKILTNISEKKLKFKTLRISGKTRRFLNKDIEFSDKNSFVLQLGIEFSEYNHYLMYGICFIPLLIIGGLLIVKMALSYILEPIQILAKQINTSGQQQAACFAVSTDSDDFELDFLTDAVNAKLERLSESIETIKSLSSQVAHELKTPIAIIRGESELALKSKRTEDDYKRVLKICKSECMHMKKIIDDLLFVTRIENAIEIFDFKKINFRSFFNELLETTKIMASTKKITIKSNVESVGNVQIKADETHLRRMFLNLIDNAIKFSNENETIELSLINYDKQIMVEIKDYGIGILDKFKNKIFERFFRINKSSSNVSGTGLGLSIVQSIARSHNFKVDFKSIPNVETIFYIKMPKL